jgi:DNA-binding transcriptional ArsR family regulator
MRTGAHRDMKSLSKERVNMVASRARAIGDPTRVRILDVLARGEQPVGQIAAAVSTQQSTVSKHLQVLFHAGLVQRRRDASVVRYWLTSDELLRWCRYLASRRLEPTSHPKARRTG